MTFRERGARLRAKEEAYRDAYAIQSVVFSSYMFATEAQRRMGWAYWRCRHRTQRRILLGKWDRVFETQKAAV